MMHGRMNLKDCVGLHWRCVRP